MDLHVAQLFQTVSFLPVAVGSGLALTLGYFALRGWYRFRRESGE